MTDPEETVESLAQKIVDLEVGGIGVRFTLAIEVLEGDDENPNLHIFYSDNMTSWMAAGHAFAIEQDAGERHPTD